LSFYPITGNVKAGDFIGIYVGDELRVLEQIFSAGTELAASLNINTDGSGIIDSIIVISTINDTSGFISLIDYSSNNYAIPQGGNAYIALDLSSLQLPNTYAASDLGAVQGNSSNLCTLILDPISDINPLVSLIVLITIIESMIPLPSVLMFKLAANSVPAEKICSNTRNSSPT
jgi:hypothetical protein